MTPSMPTTLTRLAFSGTPRDFGVALGRFGAAAVHGYLTATRGWAEITAFRDDDRVLRMERLVAERLPRHRAEIAGLAEGLGLPETDVFAWHCRGDLRAAAAVPDVPEGCTTLLVPGDEPLIAHNEDGDPAFRGACALVEARIDGGPALTAFAYPGSLPGNAFGWNAHGLVATVNNVRPIGMGVRAGEAGLPRMILGRALLDSPDLDAAARLVMDNPRAGGFHFAVAQAGDRRLISIEFTGAAVSVVALDRPSAHANHLVHTAMRDTPQIVTASSAARQQRADTILTRDPTIAPQVFLGDTAGDLPIHRAAPDDPDEENTLATLVVRARRDGLSGEVRDADGAVTAVLDGHG
ncbi:C45 family autoproteolytic acyltransferase/hydolase [Methyloraptor flagellatus]|uniref:C45 family peptidase n=1 Tax=Methyloraptor flagellatus TaxID=3162530 RepID=A0AAU7XFU4_9HYPH